MSKTILIPPTFTETSILALFADLPPIKQAAFAREVIKVATTGVGNASPVMEQIQAIRNIIDSIESNPEFQFRLACERQIAAGRIKPYPVPGWYKEKMAADGIKVPDFWDWYNVTEKISEP